MRLHLALVCLWVMTFSSMAGASSEEVVWLALSDNGSAYLEAAAAARREILRGSPALVETLPWQQLLTSGRPPPKLVIAIGSGAFAGLAESDLRAPILATLLPRAVYERWAAKAERVGHTCSAVVLDQPPGRQLELLRLALPERPRIGVLYGAESKGAAAQLRRTAEDRGVVLSAVEAAGSGKLFSQLQGLLDESDVLMAVPDPQVFNGATVQNILTAAYRRRIPLIGFSPAYVKAGALLALYSTPAQVGTQAGEQARAVLAGKPLPLPQGPRDFTIAVNADVARSLGIMVESGSAEKWTEQLRTRERQP